MVSAYMGLLDDAIREHLDLKRRRGADPAEVARQQRAVLDSGPGLDAGEELPDRTAGEPSEPLPAVAHDELPAPADGAEVGEVEASASATATAPAGAAPSQASEEQGDTVQETVELDMQRELEQEPQGASPGDAATGR